MEIEVIILILKKTVLEQLMSKLLTGTYPATSPHMGQSRIEKHVLAEILTESRNLQQYYWRSGAFPGVANSESVFEPLAPIQGASCASWMMCLSGFKPRAEWCTNGFFLPLF